MKDILLIALLSVFSIGFLTGQDGIIRGNVFDKETGEPILYGTVFLEGTTLGTNTDLDGFYSIAGVPVGEYRLVATYIGYDTAYVDVNVKDKAIIYKSINLEQSGINLGVVNISAQKQEARSEVKISKVSVSQRQIKALPSVGGEPDIVQYLQVLPGIISTGDQGGQLYIRGGSPVQNKILLDGLTLYNPFHSIGFFSVFETDLIKNVDVFTGGFGAEYGGRISAIVDISTRDGAKNRLGGFVSASPFMAKTVLEGPLKKHEEDGGSSSFVFSAKKSLTEYFSKDLYGYAADNDSIGLPFTFTDLYGKLSFNNKTGSSLDIFGFNFQDQYDNPAIASIGWQNLGVGSRFRLVPTGSDIIIGGSVGYTDYAISFDQDDDGERSSEIKELNADINFTIFGKNNEFNYGVELRSIRTDFSFLNPLDVRLSQVQSTTELSGFLKYRQVFGDKFIFEPSIRFMYYASQSNFSPEPRLGLKYNVSDNFRIKAAAGIYTQNILSTANERDVVNLFSGFLTGPESRVFDFDGTPLENTLLKSRHIVGGFEYDLSNNLSINIEGYYKDFPQLIEINRNKLNTTDPDYIKEEGEAYGVDFSVKYDYQRFYFWGTYSHGYVNRFDGVQEYPTVFDRRHNVNALFNYEFDDEGSWVASLRWNLGSGFPFTKTQGFYNNQDFDEGLDTDYETNNPDELGVIYSETRNGGRLPYYHRLDASITKNLKFSKYSGMEITVSVSNLYDRKNIFYFDRIEYDRVDQLPIIPSLSIKYNF